MKNAVKIRPPRHLSDESRAWFASVTTDFELESHHLKLLQAACESWDRAQQAREILKAEGITFVDRHGHIRPNPAVNIERDSRGLFARLVRELGLDVVEPDEVRPPRIQGMGQRAR
jgi:P27 family predicted phage terminase small subunit